MICKLAFFLSLSAAVLSAPAEDNVKFNLDPDGSFQWSYDTPEGSNQQQAGQQIAGDAGQAVQGVAQWYDPEGGLHQIQYVADQDGYRPSSNDLPVAPEIPAAILKGLQWNAAHPEEENSV